MAQSWQFIDDEGTFRIRGPHNTSYLYFPLVNEAGIMSVITPMLNGDIKAGQHQFLTPPISAFDIHNTRSGRNFWLSFPDNTPWSVTGNSAAQTAKQFSGREDVEVSLTAGFLWQKLTRKNHQLGIQTEILNYVPASHDLIELMMVQITNISEKPIRFSPTAAIPIYGRSADNLRDHRHVTSLLNRIKCERYGVVVRPTLTFDERGHQKNDLAYAVLGIDGKGQAPVGFFPLVDDFIGEGGNLSWPESVVTSQAPTAAAGNVEEGYEALGGLRFADKTLAPGEACCYILLLGILPSEAEITRLIETYGSPEKFNDWFDRTKLYWLSRQKNFSIQTLDSEYDRWLKWVSIQPTLRRLFGNSFLPYHDYGRGGRGWRDLWQDSLALMITDEISVDELLFSNFAGIRMDGSNATIIGDAPGEFKADRNNIPRVWMDHGAWPWLTIKYYIDQTGDLAILLRDQTYFKDSFNKRAQDIDEQWDPSSGTEQRVDDGGIYKGTVLEHLLVQHLTAFFNVGEHNIIRLEGADWNDGMDMAEERGESVAFGALYAGNLRQISDLVQQLKKLGIQDVEMAIELCPLLDTLGEEIDYRSPSQKQSVLEKYFNMVAHSLSGEKIKISLDDLSNDLAAKAGWLTKYIRENEWIRSQEGWSWFNGYYDNDGQQLEGDHPNGVRMTLTGQVFTLLCGIADDDQAKQIVQSVDHYLYDVAVGGPRLNTDFKEVLMNMGRCFGFAYGHKENGAMFSHMAVMYAYALYERGFVQQAYQVLMDIYGQSINFEVSRMYPGIPEYFDSHGRGVYPYLTGSASWYLFTLLTQSFGVRGFLGDLQIEPKLVLSQFDQDGKASIQTRFADRDLLITFHNPEKKEFREYRVVGVSLNGEELAREYNQHECVIPRRIFAALSPERTHRLEMFLN
jgi:cellobiose phosphorylase